MDFWALAVLEAGEKQTKSLEFAKKSIELIKNKLIYCSNNMFAEQMHN